MHAMVWELAMGFGPRHDHSDQQIVAFGIVSFSAATLTYLNLMLFCSF